MFDVNESRLNTEISNNLDISLQNAYGRLTVASKNDNFLATIAPIFGGSGEFSQFQALADTWALGDSSQLPIVQILPSSSMNGANGAFSEVNRTIYLSSDYLSQASGDRDSLTGVTGTLLEEIGHFVDSLINPGSDTPGDEGELFSANLMGLSLSTQEKYRIAQENDHSFVNVDGQIISVEQSLPDLAGNTIFVKDATNKYFAQVGTATPIAIKYNGTQISKDFFGTAWQTLAVETVNGENQVLWKHVPGNFLHIWKMDSNWNWVSGEGQWALNSTEAFNKETVFGVDANGDGLIGTVYTTIESAGNTKFIKDSGNNYFSQVETASAIAIKYNGTQISKDFFGTAWQTLAVETVNGENQVLWKHVPGNFLHIWKMDSNWNWVSGEGQWALNSTEAFNKETIFGVDANGDGLIGMVYTTIESVGNTKFIKDTSNKYFAQVGTATPIPIKNGGQIYQDIYSSDWQTLAVENVNGQNQVLWKHVPGNFLHIWKMDSNWNWVSGEGQWALNSTEAFNKETVFGVDANFDGVIGSSYTAIESVGNTKFVKDTTNKYFAQVGTTIPIAIKVNGTQISKDIYTSDWQTLAVENVNGENQVLWKHVPGNFLHIWKMDSNWNWVSGEGQWALNSAEAFTQETNFQQDFNNDGVIASPYTNETPVITVVATDASAGETATGVTANSGTFTLTRTGGLTQALTVNYTVGGTGTKGTDYSNLTGTVSFVAGAATALVTITPIDDTLVEENETVILTLAAGTGYTVGTTNTGTVTIADNDVLPVITIVATDASAGETATGVTANPGTFTLTRTGELTQALTVNYTLAGTGIKGTDYSNLTGTVSFAAGAATALVTITPIDDTLPEGNETVILTLAAGTGYTVGTTNTGTVTIADNEVLPVITIAATDGSAGETATGVTANPGTFTLTRTGVLTQALTVNYTLAGTGIKGTDYSNLTGTVSFAAGAATALVTITPIDDTLPEGNETVILTLAAGTGYTVGTTNTGTVTIADNEVLPVITIAATDGSAGETATGVTANPGIFTLTRTGVLTQALTVNYTISGTGTKGTDYSNLTGTVSFAAGAATALVTITPIDDTLPEGNETVILTLAAGTGYTVGTTNTGTVTIADNEVLPMITVVQGLSSVKKVLSALDNIFTQNSLLTQKLDFLSKRIDINTAATFIGDAKIRFDQVLVNLNNSSNLDLKTIVDQLSNAISSIGTVTVAVDGQLITPTLMSTINLKPDSEIIFNFDFSKISTITESLAGAKKFTIAETETDTNISGNASGSASLGFKFSLGIDKLGKAFINEGGLLSSIVDLNSTLSGSASIKGLANGAVSGSGKLTLNTQLKIDDGDTISNERLYLSDATLGTLFASNAISFAGGIKLNDATIKVSIANLSAFELPIAASGSLNFLTGKAEFTFQQDALLDTLVNAAEKGIGSLANQSAKIAQFTKNIPLLGNSLSTALTSTITKGLGFDAPVQGTRAYLASRNITVEKIITLDQFFSGNFLTADVLLLRYNPSVSEILQLANTSGGFDAGLAKLTLNGNLQATPNLSLDVRFGLDLANGPFILEGGTINAQLPITGSFNGTASIGKLLTGQVNISNASLNPTAKLTFSDFDNIANERFYLLGSNNTLSLDTILGKKEAIALTGNLALDAALTVENPAQNLKIPLLNKLNLGSFGWNASVQYDLVTGQATYTIKDDAKIAAIVSLFKGNEQGIIDLFLGDLITSNPLPANVRKILTEKIPLLDKNLLDIIGVPEAAQLLINPEKFKGKNLTEINQNGIKLSFDFFSASSIVNLLSGNDLNLISLDIQQAFTAPTQKIPVIVTPVFSAFGIINVIADVGIEAAASFLIDTTIGFDTVGFYVLESGSVAPSGRTLGNMLFFLDPKLSAVLTGTLLVTALPLIDISGKVFLSGQIGIRLDDAPFNPATDLDPKVRLSGLTNLENLHLAIAIDLGLGLTSTLFPVRNFGIPLIKDGEVQKTVPLYNGEVGSIADIKDDVKSFINKTKLKGAVYLYGLGIITANPVLTTAAISIAITSPQAGEAFSALGSVLRDSGRDMLGAAKGIVAVVGEYGIDLGQTAKFLYQEFSGGIVGVAHALYEEVTQDLRRIARGLYDGVTTSLDRIAKALYDGVVQDIGKIAKMIIAEFGYGFFFSLDNLIIQFLPDGIQIHDLYQNGVRISEQIFSAAGDLATYIEFFGDGVSHKLEEAYQGGVRTAQRLWRAAGDLSDYIEFFGDGSYKLKEVYAAGLISKLVWRAAGDLAADYLIWSDGYFITEYVGGQVTKMSTYVGGQVTRIAEYVGGAERKISEYIGGQVTKVSEYVGDYLAAFPAFKVSEYVGGQVAKATEYVGGQVAKVTEYVGDQVAKVTEYVGGQVTRISDYVDGQVTRIWDTVEGTWDSVLGWVRPGGC